MARCLSVAFLLGSDRLRSAVVLPFVMTGLLATGCAQSRVATRTDKWERVPSSARVVLMTPDIELAELTAGGVLEPNAEWTELAKIHVVDALQAPGTRDSYPTSHPRTTRRGRTSTTSSSNCTQWWVARSCSITTEL